MSIAPIAAVVLGRKAVPTYLGGFDGADTTAWARVVNGVFTEVKSGNVDTVASGDIVTVSNPIVGDVQGLQLDGVTEYASFAATAAYLAGITTKGTLDIVMRVDTHSENRVFAAIADDINLDDAADSFMMSFQGIPHRFRGSFRYNNVKGPTRSTTTIVDGTTYHFRQSFNSTSGTQVQSVFTNSMGTAEATTALVLNQVLANAGTTALTLGSLEGGAVPAAATILEFMIRIGEHSDQLPAFA